MTDSYDDLYQLSEAIAQHPRLRRLSWRLGKKRRWYLPRMRGNVVPLTITAEMVYDALEARQEFGGDVSPVDTRPEDYAHVVAGDIQMAGRAHAMSDAYGMPVTTILTIVRVVLLVWKLIQDRRAEE